MLDTMRREGEGFYHFAMRMSQQHKTYFSSCDLGPEQRAMYSRLTEESLARQKTIEADNGESFTDYLARYFAQSV